MTIYVVAIKDLVHECDYYMELIGYHETEEDALRTIELMKHDQKLLKEIHRDRMSGIDMPVCDFGSRWWTLCEDSYEIVVLKVECGPLLRDGDALEKAKHDLDARRQRDLARVSIERLSIMEERVRKIEKDISEEKQRREMVEWHRCT